MRRDTSHDLLLCALYYRTFVADRASETRPRELYGDSPFGTAEGEAGHMAASGN